MPSRSPEESKKEEVRIKKAEDVGRVSRARLKVRSKNGANGMSDIEHVAIGNRAGRRQRS